MPIPNIDDDGWTDKLDAACAVYLGSTIQYQPSDGSYAPVKAHIDYREAAKGFSGVEAITQDMTVAVRKIDVPIRPGSGCRVILPRVPGDIFKPANVRSDESGTHWEFEVVKTNA